MRSSLPRSIGRSRVRPKPTVEPSTNRGEEIETRVEEHVSFEEEQVSLPVMVSGRVIYPSRDRPEDNDRLRAALASYDLPSSGRGARVSDQGDGSGGEEEEGGGVEEEGNTPISSGPRDGRNEASAIDRAFLPDRNPSDRTDAYRRKLEAVRHSPVYEFLQIVGTVARIDVADILKDESEEASLKKDQPAIKVFHYGTNRPERLRDDVLRSYPARPPEGTERPRTLEEEDERQEEEEEEQRLRDRRRETSPASPMPSGAWNVRGSVTPSPSERKRRAAEAFLGPSDARPAVEKPTSERSLLELLEESAEERRRARGPSRPRGGDKDVAEVDIDLIDGTMRGTIKGVASDLAIFMGMVSVPQDFEKALIFSGLTRVPFGKMVGAQTNISVLAGGRLTSRGGNAPLLMNMKLYTENRAFVAQRTAYNAGSRTFSERKRR